ncbi:MAG: biotin synthase BioB [Syntrophales bacterium]|jgi:biotin synthase|nr:biotin synthase BioB [Syntrophales bacterium]
MFNQQILHLAKKIIGDHYLPSYEESCALARLPETETFDLLACAGKITQHFKEDHVTLCAILNAKSGFCTEDCAFCAQSAHHRTGISTYDLKTEAFMVADARERQIAGATRFSMVTSGLTLTDEEIKTICRSAERISRDTAVTVCASVGTITSERAQALKASGVSVYHHNLETARSFFHEICSTHAYEDDINTLKRAKKAGLRICSGGILGLGETWEQRVELACTLRDLDVDGIPLNFLNPIAGTRMENRPVLSPMDALKSIALFRFVNPDRDIFICGGRELILKDFQSWIFLAGANGFMVGNYLTTQGRNTGMDMEIVRALNLKPSLSET